MSTVTKFRLADKTEVDFFTNNVNRQDHSAAEALKIIGTKSGHAPFTKKTFYPDKEDFGVFSVSDEKLGLVSGTTKFFCLKLQREATGETGFILLDKSQLIPVGE